MARCASAAALHGVLQHRAKGFFVFGGTAICDAMLFWCHNILHCAVAFFWCWSIVVGSAALHHAACFAWCSIIVCVPSVVFALLF